MDDLYFAIAHPLNSKRKLMPFSELYTLYGETEVYRSLYAYPREALDYNGELKDYPTRLVYDIVFDLDPQENMSLTENIDLAIELLMRHGIRKEHIYPYFSGRGWHIHVPNVWGFTSEDIPDIVRATIDGIIPWADNIYDRNRVIRLENTFNKKTNRKKIYIDQKNPKRLNILLPKLINNTSYHVHKIPEIEPYLKKVNLNRLTSLKTSFKGYQENVTPKRYTCIHRLWGKGPQKGNRHKILLRLASHYKWQDYRKEVTLRILKTWMESDPLPFDELKKLVNDTYRANNGQGYHYGCLDEILKQHCYSGCILNRIGVQRETMKNPTESLLKYLQERPIIDLKYVLNLKYPFEIYKQDFITIQGEGGIGKTTMMVFMAAQFERPIRWINLEDKAEAIYYKWVQMMTRKNKNELLEYLKQGKDGFYIDRLRVTQMNKDRTLDKIEKEVFENCNEDIIFIDHAGAIDPGDYSSYQWMKFLAANLKNLAERTNKVIFISTHKGRNSNNSNQMMNEVNSDAIITIEIASATDQWERSLVISSEKKARRNLSFTKNVNLNLKNMEVIV